MTQTILCLSSYFKGAAFLQSCKEAGLHVILATNDKNKDEPWPREYIDEFFHMPDLGKRPDIIHCHDWATGLVPVLLFEIYQYHGMRPAGVLHHSQFQAPRD